MYAVFQERHPFDKRKSCPNMVYEEAEARSAVKVLAVERLT